MIIYTPITLWKRLYVIFQMSRYCRKIHSRRTTTMSNRVGEPWTDEIYGPIYFRD